MSFSAPGIKKCLDFWYIDCILSNLFGLSTICSALAIKVHDFQNSDQTIHK